MELLWKSHAKDGGRQVATPAWHAQVLSARRAKVEAGQGEFLSLDELKKRLRTVSCADVIIREGASCSSSYAD
jgi:hypothetical protein